MDKRDFKVGDLVRYDGELITVTPHHIFYTTDQFELVESVEERIARFDTVNIMKKRLKKQAKKLGWKTKRAVYLEPYDRLYDKKGNLIYKEGKFNTPKK